MFEKTIGDALDESRGATIPMVQAADLRNGNDSAALRRFNLAFNRRVAIQREVSSRFVEVDKVRAQDTLEMSLV